MEDDKLKEIIEEAIEPSLKNEFIKGVVAGWNACLITIRRNTNELTNVKDIKAYIKKEIDESKERMNNYANNKEGK